MFGDLESLVQKRGVEPFLGARDGDDASYPSRVATNSEQFDGDAPTLEDLVEILPNAETRDVYIRNGVVDVDGSTKTVDLDKIRDIDSLDTDSIESLTGQSLEDLAAKSDPDALTEAASSKAVVDPRREALNVFQPNITFHWQIASSAYNPGDMPRLFREAIDAGEQLDILDDMFGWIRYRDSWGHGQVVCVFPALEFAVEETKALSYDSDVGGYTPTDAAIDDDAVDDIDPADTSSGVPVYYGFKTEYGFRGAQKIETQAIVFFPSHGTYQPLGTDDRFSFERKHVGAFMDDSHERDEGRVPPMEWFEQILTDLENYAGVINQKVAIAQSLQFDTSDADYSLENFFRYIGVSQTTYAEAAAKRARQMGGASPSFLTLSLALKLILLEEFQGAKASDKFQELQELAGELLHRPVLQYQIAEDGYTIEQETTDRDGDEIDSDDLTTVDSVDALDEDAPIDVDGANLAKAQQIQASLDDQLDAAAADDTAES